MVLATVNKIRESGIFSDDFQFLRHMAAAKTKDGETFTPSTGGIWKVSEDVFNKKDVNEYMLREGGQSLVMDIESAFAFSWIENMDRI